MRGGLLPVLAVIGLLSLCAVPVHAQKKSTKDWSKVDMNQLEKDWRDGDDEWVLENEYDYQRKVGESRAKKAPKFDPKNPQNIVRSGGMAAMNNHGPTMMFVDLKHRPSSAGPWTRETIDEVAAKWKQLSQTGGLSINCYNLGKSTSSVEADGTVREKILVSLDKGWQGRDAVKFLTDRPETALVTWNGNTFLSTYQGEWDGEL